jgi:hypothetical protein
VIGVKISAEPIIDPIDGTQNWLMITVDYDGQACPPANAPKPSSGKRLDETKPGRRAFHRDRNRRRA